LCRRPSGRASFKLIELLVVIAIIAALMALSASAVIKFLGSQEEANTKATFNKVQSQLNKAWSKVKDEAYKAPMTEIVPANAVPPPTPSTNTAGKWIQANLAGTDANATNRTRALYVKLKLRQAFPMNFAEALNVPYTNPELANWDLSTAVPASPLPALPAYQTYLGSMGITGSSATTASYESSVCLLMALQRGVSGAGINPDLFLALPDGQRFPQSQWRAGRRQRSGRPAGIHQQRVVDTAESQANFQRPSLAATGSRSSVR
jgi:Tfp pilus assembly protein FimT